MPANIILVVERIYPYSRDKVFRAFTDPDELAHWRGPVGWHVPVETIESDLRTGGRHRHVKVNDDDPANTQTTEAIFTEFFVPDVFVARQRITGAPGVDPSVPLELRVEFTKSGKDNTLVRVVQGPYDPSVATDYSDGWEGELGKLATYLERTYGPERG